MTKRANFIVFLSFVFWFGGLSIVHAEYEDAGRVSDLDGKIFFQSGRSLDWQEGFLNSPVLEGDRIWTDITTFAELQLNAGRLIRFWGDTKLDVLDIKSDNLTGKLWLGSMYIRLTDDPDRARPVLIETSDGAFRLLTKGLFRFDVLSSNATQLRIFDGVAEFRSGSRTMSLRTGEMIVIQSGSFPGTISRFSLSERDPLGRYNDDRDNVLLNADPSPYLDDSMSVGSVELDYYGTWVYDTSYGYCWRPRVAVGWVPYRFGRWLWIFPWGWTWISYEPWGWLPYHYGYWSYSSYYGWIWYPDRYFAPAWVVWTAHSGSIGWVPVHPDDIRHTHWNAHENNSRHILASISSPRNASLHIGIQAGTHIPHSVFESGKMITNNDLVRMNRTEVTQWRGSPPADIKPDRPSSSSVPSQRLQAESRAKMWNEQDSRSPVSPETWRHAVNDHRTSSKSDTGKGSAIDRRTTTPNTRDSRSETRAPRSDSQSESKPGRGTPSGTRPSPREPSTSPATKPAEKSYPTYRQPYDKPEASPRSSTPDRAVNSSRPSRSSQSSSARPSPSNDRSPSRPSAKPAKPSNSSSSSSSSSQTPKSSSNSARKSN